MFSCSYFNLSDRHVGAYSICESSILNMQIRGELMLTTQRYGSSLTTLWNFPDVTLSKDFEDPVVTWAQFSNNSAERIVLTADKETILWDTTTSKHMLKLPIGEKGCGYSKNRSYFGPYDDQILSGMF